MQNKQSLSISLARKVTFRVLQLLETNEQLFSHETLHFEAKANHLDQRDLRLATAIVFGVLRNGLLLDYQYQSFLKKGSAKLSSEIRILLRMAVFQKLFLDKIPVFAIVNDTVEVGRKVAKLNKFEIGFLNALARKISRLDTVIYPHGNSLKALSIRYSHPEWMTRLYYNKFASKTEDILKHNNVEPRHYVRVNTVQSNVDSVSNELTELGYENIKSDNMPSSLIITSPLSGLFEQEIFLRGDIYVQDEASQLVSWIANPKTGNKVLDYCSAPGGKAMQIASMVGQSGVVVATDISQERLKLVEENKNRLHVNNLKICSMEEMQASGDKFDLVLVDAPCSGSGTLARNPELKYRLSEGGIADRSALQKKILNDIDSFLKPNGRLVYSTCSITDAENKQVIEEFIKDHPAYGIISESENSLPILSKLIQSDGFYRTWPIYCGMDGFECVVLQKHE